MVKFLSFLGLWVSIILSEKPTDCGDGLLKELLTVGLQRALGAKPQLTIIGIRK